MTRFHFVMQAVHAGNMDKHEALAHSVPLVPISAPHSRKLAIVGGGPSVQTKLKKLRQWKGDIWAINATVGYLSHKGIKSTLVSVDPIVLEPEDFDNHKGAENALLAACCDPKLFEEYAGMAQTYYTRPNPRAPFVATGGCTTATRLPMLAISMGYRDITFFGCEGSYEHESHIHENRRGDKRLYILAGGVRYCTEPHMMSQCEWLSDAILKYPQGLSEESGGLLRAMIRHPDWTMIGVSDAMKNHMEESHRKHKEKSWLHQIPQQQPSL